MKHHLLKLSLLLLAFAGVVNAQVVQPIKNGRLDTALAGNTQDITNLGHVTIGNATAGSARIHLFPGGNPTTAADGIWLGDDVKLYRTASGAMTILGNVTVTGTISAGNATVTLSGANTWTGTNAYSGTVTINSGLLVDNSGVGITFGTGAAAATRANLGLIIGTNVQSYSAQTAALSLLTPSNNAFIIGNGSTFIAASGSTVRTAAGLGTGDSPSFAGVTATGDSILGDANTDTITVNGKLLVPSATSLTYATTIGGTTLYTSGGVLVIGNDISVGGIAGSAGLALANATSASTAIVLGGDAKLYRSAASKLKTDGAFEATAMTLTTTPLAGSSGGLGFAVSGADKFPYSTGVNTWAEGALSAFVRGTFSASDGLAFRVAIGLSTAGGDLTGTLPSPTIATGAVTSAKIADATIVAADIADGTITATQLADNTVTSAKMSTTGVTGGIYGSSTAVPQITVDAKGRITGVTSVTVTGAAPGGAAGGGLTGNFPSPTIASDAVGTAQITDGAIIAADLASNAVTTAKITDANVTSAKLANTTVTAGTYPSSTTLLPQITVNAQGQITAASSVAFVGGNNTYEVINGSSAADTDVTYATGSHAYSGIVNLAAGAGAYTYRVVLPTTGRVAGDSAIFAVSIAASANPTIEFRNSIPGGSLLKSYAGDAARARTYYVSAAYSGTTWVLLFAEEMPSSLNLIGNVVITPPASQTTLTLGSGKTIAISNSITITSNDGATLNVGAGGTLASMAYQASGAVAITGGTITVTSVTTSGANISGGTVTGVTFSSANATITGGSITSATDVDSDDLQSKSTQVPSFFFGTDSWDPISLVDGASTSVDIPVPGALTGDLALAQVPLIDTTKFLVSATVSGFDQVTVTIMNKSGGSVDLSSTDVNVIVMHWTP